MVKIKKDCQKSKLKQQNNKWAKKIFFHKICGLKFKVESFWVKKITKKSKIFSSKDGFDDLIVSAPFENSVDKSGSIFIFYGIDKIGINSNPTQIIENSKFTDYFGFSISATENHLTIGSPKTNEVLIFPILKSVRIEIVNATLTAERNGMKICRTKLSKKFRSKNVIKRMSLVIFRRKCFVENF